MARRSPSWLPEAIAFAIAAGLMLWFASSLVWG